MSIAVGTAPSLKVEYVKRDDAVIGSYIGVRQQEGNIQWAFVPVDDSILPTLGTPGQGKPDMMIDPPADEG